MVVINFVFALVSMYAWVRSGNKDVFWGISLILNTLAVLLTLIKHLIVNASISFENER